MATIYDVMLRNQENAKRTDGIAVMVPGLPPEAREIMARLIPVMRNLDDLMERMVDAVGDHEQWLELERQLLNARREQTALVEELSRL
jgi:hypothetical protein